MQYLRGWRAYREDPDGNGKLLYACLIGLTMFCVPVVGQIALMGWASLIVRRAVSGQDAPLPRLDFNLDYLAKLLSPGFKPFLARLIWSMPLVAIVMIFYVCMGIGMFSMIGGVAAGAQAGSEAGAGAGAILGIVIMGFGWLFFVVMLVVMNLVMIVVSLRVHVTDDLNSAFKVKDVLKMTRMLFWELVGGGFVMYFIWMGVVFASAFTLYLLLPFGAMIMFLIMTFWEAELYQRYLEKGGEPLPIGPLTVEGGDIPHVGSQNPSAWTAPAQF